MALRSDFASRGAAGFGARRRQNPARYPHGGVTGTLLGKNRWRILTPKRRQSELSTGMPTAQASPGGRAALTRLTLRACCANAQQLRRFAATAGISPSPDIYPPTETDAGGNFCHYPQPEGRRVVNPGHQQHRRRASALRAMANLLTHNGKAD
ncbi:hypothetical protein [Pandoraea communis]|uniref:hypothetical protein n=1 Tax=Pandoraea communis TaxID=2508297 RepID=UPI00123F752E|nr:hypothetical protein [Pandoraea communis]